MKAKTLIKKVLKPTYEERVQMATKEINKVMLKYNVTLTPTIQVLDTQTHEETENTNNS